MKRMLVIGILMLLALAEVIGANETTSAKLEAFMQTAADDGYVGAVIVAKGDEILLREGYGLIDPDEDRRVTPDTVFTTGSITKQFTAAAILKLEEMGKLTVTDPITKYFDDVPAGKRSITIHHLLTHQAGFPGAIGDDRERVGRDEYVRRALETGLLFEPGTAYEYSNVGFSIAAAIIEKVSGSGYEQFLHQQLFEPAGMKDTGYTIPRWSDSRLAHGRTDDGGDWGTMRDRLLSEGGPGWHLLGNGGIQSTVDDMARWHRALMEDDLSAVSKKKMYAKHADEGGGTWYGYGWSIEPTPWGEMITHNGGNPYFFSDYLRFPEHDVVIYYSNASRDRRHNQLARKLAQIVFTGEMPELGPKPGAVVPVGAASDAPAGSAAAKWGFPGSYRGLRAAEFLEAVVSGDETMRKKVVAESMSPGVVQRNGAERLMTMFDSLREELGTFEVRGVRPSGDSGVDIVLDLATGMTMLIQLKLETAEPHRIDGVGIEVGD